MRAGLLINRAVFYKRRALEGDDVGGWEKVFSRRVAMPRGVGGLKTESGQPLDARQVKILVRDTPTARTITIGWRAFIQDTPYLVVSVSPAQLRDRSIEISLEAHVTEEIL